MASVSHPTSTAKNTGTAPRPLRLVCTDLDGTLLDFERGVRIDPRFFERLAAWKAWTNVLWVINTGRWWDSLALEMAERGFPVAPDWLILTEREIYKVHNHRPVGDYAWNHHCAAVHQQLFNACGPFWTEVRDFVTSQTGAELLREPWSPVGIRARNEQEADRIEKFIASRLPEWPKLTQVRNSIWFRFAHVDFNKGTCLGYLQELLGITPDETLAAGDHYNDLPMLDRQYARWLVCPANSIPPVKAAVRDQGGHVARQNTSCVVVEGWDALLGVPA
jgi:hypothetical protein